MTAGKGRFGTSMRVFDDKPKLVTLRQMRQAAKLRQELGKEAASPPKRPITLPRLKFMEREMPDE